MKIGFAFLLTFCVSFNVHSQKVDTISHPLRIVVPAALATSALTIMCIDGLKERWQPKLQSGIPNVGNVDDVLAVSPALIAITAQLSGVKSRHNIYTKSLIAIKAGVISFGLTYALKYATHIQRPDQSDFLSFPSGHSQVAFLGAAFTDLEFRDASLAYPISAYALATATGAMRIEHNKHWISDVLMGAAIGMGSVWIADAIQTDLPNPKWIPDFLKQASISPIYDSKMVGLSMALVF